MGSSKLAKVNDHAYEDIDPKMEWVNDAEFDTLLVHLPGFAKQQLRIQAATGDRTLNITGKRRQGDSKWIRFNKVLTVPSDYDLDQIGAKFEGGVLNIKHPKKITSPTNPVEENDANSTAEPQKPANEKTQDQKSGQDSAALSPKSEKEPDISPKVEKESAAQELPPKTEKESAARGVLPKTETEGQTSGNIEWHANTSTEANLNDQKSTNHGLPEAKVTGSSDKQETDGSRGLSTKKKKLRMSTTLVVSAGLFVLVLVFYVQKATRYPAESEN